MINKETKSEIEYANHAYGAISILNQNNFKIFEKGC